MNIYFILLALASSHSLTFAHLKYMYMELGPNTTSVFKGFQFRRDPVKRGLLNSKM